VSLAWQYSVLARTVRTVVRVQDPIHSRLCFFHRLDEQFFECLPFLHEVAKVQPARLQQGDGRVDGQSLGHADAPAVPLATYLIAKIRELNTRQNLAGRQPDNESAVLFRQGGNRSDLHEVAALQNGYAITDHLDFSE
jgi:hypothetical protein